MSEWRESTAEEQQQGRVLVVPDEAKTLLHRIRDRNVMFVDCAPSSRLQWCSISYVAKRVLVLDHHPSTIGRASGLNNVLDYVVPGVAGCVLSWRYFHGQRKVPPFLEYIAKRDLWQLDDVVDAFVAWFYDPQHTPQTIETYMAYYRDSSKLYDAIRYGKEIVAEKNELVKQICQQARPATLNGLRVGVVETEMMRYASDIGAAVSQEYGAAAVVQTPRTDGQPYKISLRSRDASIDVSVVARQFNGGGHVQAASFMATKPLQELFVFVVEDHMPST